MSAVTTYSILTLFTVSNFGSNISPGLVKMKILSLNLFESIKKKSSIFKSVSLFVDYEIAEKGSKWTVFHKVDSKVEYKSLRSFVSF